MKKLIVVAIAMLSLVSMAKSASEIVSKGEELKAAGDKQALMAYSDSLTYAERKSVMDYMYDVALTNKEAAARMFYSPFNIGKWMRYKTPDLAKYFDEKMSKVEGLLVNGILYYDMIPLTSEKILSETSIYTNNYPLLVSLVRKHKTVLINELASFPEQINVFAEISVYGLVSQYRGPNHIKYLLWKSQKAIKRRIREMGGSFVVGEDGVNPVQNAVDELSKCINSPKMEGLKEWTLKWFPDYKWTDVKWFDDEYISKLKDDIFYGEKNFLDFRKAILKAHLGVDAYNEFVKKYNGTVK